MSTTEVTTDLGLAASFHQDGERLAREIAPGPRSWASFIDNPRPSGDELGDGGTPTCADHDRPISAELTARCAH
ncbi:MAG: hypothetical protein M5U31_16245 [Acidimicrobiia bacterium]|nr:hypothetical protein [Acidimicrobiia bacterium]